MNKNSLYPTLTAEKIEKPNRLYALPFFGFLLKLIVLIPAYIVLMVFGVLAGIFQIINSLRVFTNGAYRDDAYNYTLSYMRYSLKISFFLFGLTDKYPGFDSTIKDSFSIAIQKPQNPGKFFAIPLVGGFVRIFFLIPYFIFINVMQYAAFLGVVASSIPVLLKGRYPDSIFELARDYVRLNLATASYLAGLSDSYPSFYISLSHKAIKITLIIFGVLAMLLNFFGKSNNSYKSSYQNSQYQHNSLPQQTR